jgi:hypothetical protein
VVWNGKTGWVFGGFLADGPGADRAGSDDVITEEEISGTSCSWVLAPDEQMDSMEFKIYGDMNFEAECILGGSGKTKLTGTWRVIKEKNRIRIIVSGMDDGFYAAETEGHWSKKFANGEITIWKKGGKFYGTSKNMGSCMNFTDKEISVRPLGK